MDCSPTGSFVHGDSPGKNWSGLPCPPPGDLPNPGTEPRSPALQVYSLPPKPQGKPKNTGVGSLSLLQQIFPTEESKQGLPTQESNGSPALQVESSPLSHQGSPVEGAGFINRGTLGSVVAAPGLICSTVCEMFPGQGLNPYPLY